MSQLASSATVRWGRLTYALLALPYGLFIIYGSLVPFRFHPVHLADALMAFRAVVTSPIHVDSRADLAVNFLLVMPFGYLMMAALRTDRQRWTGHVIAAAATISSVPDWRVPWSSARFSSPHGSWRSATCLRNP
ncbi:MAG: hypothetical protein QM736_06345 [Vicinamibacterales bacterium]